MPLGEPRAKEGVLKFLEGTVGIVGLTKLNYACLSRIVLDNQLKFGITHGQIQWILGGLGVHKTIKHICVYPLVLDDMLLNGNDRALLNHHDIRVAVNPIFLVDVLEWDNVFSNYI